MTSSHLPSLAVVSTEIGIPSEVWMLRQAQAFTGFQPRIWGWSQHESFDGFPGPLPDTQMETHLIKGAFPTPQGLLARGLRKMGHPGAYRLGSTARQALREIFDAQKPDVVLVHFGWNAIAVAQALPAGVPMVVHVHGRDASAMMQEPAYRAALSQTLKRADAMVAVGQHQIEALQPLGLPDKVALIPCGAPLDLFAAQPIPEQPSMSAENPIRFATVGRLSDEKGMRESLAAFALVHQDMPQSELVIIGFGPLYDPLQKEVADLGLEGAVRLTGRLSPQDIVQELAQAHVYLQHSRQHKGWVEGFGVTLTEAGAMGLPLVATASGGLQDQIDHGENGYLFAQDDIEAQAKWMRQLARDPQKRTQMGQKARHMAARFDSQKMTAKLEEVLLSLLP